MKCGCCSAPKLAFFLSTDIYLFYTSSRLTWNLLISLVFPHNTWLIAPLIFTVHFLPRILLYLTRLLDLFLHLSINSQLLYFFQARSPTHVFSLFIYFPFWQLSVSFSCYFTLLTHAIFLYFVILLCLFAHLVYFLFCLLHSLVHFSYLNFSFILSYLVFSYLFVQFYLFFLSLFFVLDIHIRT